MGAVMLACLIHVLLFLMGLLDHSSGVVYKKQLSSSVINTRYGKVRGMLVEFPNDLRPTIAYLGLRYADLDQGSMRFMPPKSPMERWSGTASAVGNQTACPQPKPLDRDLGVPEERAARLRNISPFLHNQVEDCLTLNIYVPTKGKYYSLHSKLRYMFIIYRILVFDKSLNVLLAMCYFDLTHTCILVIWYWSVTIFCFCVLTSQLLQDGRTFLWSPSQPTASILYMTPILSAFSLGVLTSICQYGL